MFNRLHCPESRHHALWLILLSLLLSSCSLRDYELSACITAPKILAAYGNLIESLELGQEFPETRLPPEITSYRRDIVVWDNSKGKLVVESPLSEMNTVPLEAEFLTARNSARYETTDEYLRLGPASAGNFIRKSTKGIGIGGLSLMRGFQVHAGIEYQKLMVKRYRKIGELYEEILFTLHYAQVLQRLDCRGDT